MSRPHLSTCTIGAAFILVTVHGAAAGTLATLHVFSKNEGTNPFTAPLTIADGLLWGITTSFGGPNGSDGSDFNLSLDGASFASFPFSGGGPNKKAYAPDGGLVQHGAVLYGTTEKGGAYGSGTVYVIGAQGHRHIVYSFGMTAGDGQTPGSQLLNIGGALYGTTYAGGAYGYGTVFKIMPQGDETVLYSFNPKGTAADGANPLGRLIHVGGTFYGATYQGGAANCGTIFSLTPTGQETVLHEMDGLADGCLPHAGLTVLDGRFYGTTIYDGNKDGTGTGTIFRIARTGHYEVLHRFGKKQDGQYPYSGLVAMGSMLYGTTYQGGTAELGTIYSVTPEGTETVLHSFAGTDGSGPYGALTSSGGVLYGTTYGGGAANFGTVFSFSP